MRTLIIALLLFLPQKSYAQPNYDGVWYLDGQPVIEIRGLIVKEFGDYPDDASVCIARYETAVILADALEVQFEYICGDGSSGGIGVSTFILDGDNLAELSCDGMLGTPKDKMNCDDPEFYTRGDN